MSGPFRFDWVVVDKMTGKKPQTTVPASPEARPRRTGTGFDDVSLVAADPPTVRTEKMTAAEAAEEARSPRVAATLVEMPLCLIEPARRTGEANPSGEPPWGIQDIGATGAAFSGKGVTVAVLDTGIDRDHEAFQAHSKTLLACNFTQEGSEGDVTDHDGHGTHCAGTIVGGEVGGLRIGVAPDVSKVLIGKVIGKNSGGDTKTLVRALHWSILNGADVISMSLGMDFAAFFDRLIKVYRLPSRRAAAIALEAYRMNLDMFNKLSASIVGTPGLVDGALVVGAAGNESEMPGYTIPASIPSSAVDFVSVAALSRPVGGRYELAPFSNVGAKLGAPGVGIVSAKPGGGLATMDGTSMAAPHVAGAACLWIEKLHAEDGGATTAALIERLNKSAASLPPEIGSEMVRWGRVQVPTN